MDIIDITVAIIIDTIARNFSGICPDIANQVGMVDEYASIDYPDRNAPGTGGNIPGLGCIDVRVNGTSCLPRIMQAVQAIETGIVR